jgi:hypothetical protein
MQLAVDDALGRFYVALRLLRLYESPRHTISPKFYFIQRKSQFRSRSLLEKSQKMISHSSVVHTSLPVWDFPKRLCLKTGAMAPIRPTATTAPSTESLDSGWNYTLSGLRRKYQDSSWMNEKPRVSGFGFEYLPQLDERCFIVAKIYLQFDPVRVFHHCAHRRINHTAV